jgi:hypothetical protein
MGLGLFELLERRAIRRIANLYKEA